MIGTRCSCGLIEGWSGVIKDRHPTTLTLSPFTSSISTPHLRLQLLHSSHLSVSYHIITPDATSLYINFHTIPPSPTLSLTTTKRSPLQHLTRHNVTSTSSNTLKRLPSQISDPTHHRTPPHLPLHPRPASSMTHTPRHLLRQNLLEHNKNHDDSNTEAQAR